MAYAKDAMKNSNCLISSLNRCRRRIRERARRSMWAVMAGLFVIGLANLNPVPTQAQAKVLAPDSSSMAVTKARGAPAQKRRAANISALQLDAMTPLSANPYLSFLPAGAKPDYPYWRAKLKADAKNRAKIKQTKQSSLGSLLAFATNEGEPVGIKGVNDSSGTAEFIAGFGTGNTDDSQADISGDLRAPTAPLALGPFAEDDGDIIQANATGLTTDQSGTVSATIGDGPFGSTTGATPTVGVQDAEDEGDINLATASGVGTGAAVIFSANIGDGLYGSGGTGSGDFDFFSVSATAGQTISVDVDTISGGITGLDSIVAIYNSSGTMLAFNDDDGLTFDSLLSFTTSTTDTFFVTVGSFNFFVFPTSPASFLVNPLDSTSGPGAFSEGDYDVTIGVNSGAALGSGDFDFYSITATAGQLISVDVDTPVPFGHLDPIVGLFDSSGTLLDFNDDGNASSFDSFLLFQAPANDTYYIAVGGWRSFNTALDFPASPFNSSTGPGSGSEGDYDVTIGLDVNDLDFYAFDLVAGDVIGANITGGGTFVSLFDPTFIQLVGSTQDFSGIYPASSLLPGGGVAAAAYVAPTTGMYTMLVSIGSGAYTLQLRAFRPTREMRRGPQVVFLDFDGETLDTSIFGGPGVAALSPLSSFLAGWALSGTDENAVIDAIVASFEENLKTDLAAMDNNPDFDIEVRNSRDDADPFGRLDVSRVVVGGRITELGVSTIGIAESIDPGNFDWSESAVVLLDLLSGPAADPNSLNSIALGGGATIIDLIGEAIGSIAAHEAGHFFASFHTDNANALPNIMDSGGNLGNTLGVGPDGIFGTGDDVDVDFEFDSYAPSEGFSGLEDTLNITAFGLTTSPFGQITSLADQNSNGSAEVLLIRRDRDDGSNHAITRDGLTDALLGDVNFGTDPLLDFTSIEDLDASGARELIAVGQRPSNQIRAQIKDSETGAKVANRFFGTKYTDRVSVTSLADVSGDALSDMSVIGQDPLTLAVRMQVQNPLTGSVLNNIFDANNYTPHGLFDVSDMNFSGAPELVSSGTVITTQQVRHRSRDSLTDAIVKSLFHGTAYKHAASALVPDINGNGSMEVAEAGRRLDNDSVRSQLRDLLTGAPISNAFLGSIDSPIDVTYVADTNANGFFDIVTLLERDADGSVRGRVTDGMTGNFIRVISFGAISNPQRITTVSDLDGDGFDDVAALGFDNNGFPRIQIKDSNSGGQVNNIDFP